MARRMRRSTATATCDLQYLAGLSAHDYHEAAIFNEMLKYRRYPEKLFIASAANSKELRWRLGMPKADD